MNESINFLLAGVGGQGTILASDLLVNVGLAAGYQAKQAEVHGMSQRGGSVVSHVRWGEVVHSPLIGAGEVDVYVAFEKLEALRHLNKIRPGALVLVNLEAIMPVSLTTSDVAYPDDEQVRASVAKATSHAIYIDAARMAAELGNARVANVIMLGALAQLMEQQSLTDGRLGLDTWLKAVAEGVPAKYVELNQKAFLAGRAMVAKGA